MYKVELLKDKKVVFAVTTGLIKLDEAQEYVAKLKEVFSSINTPEYNFILDVSEFKPVLQEGKELLHTVVELYRGTVFKNKYYIMPKSFIATKQASSGGVPEYFIEVNSFDEAMSLIK